VPIIDAGRARTEYEVHLIKPDGEPVPVLLAHVPRMSDGKYVGGILVVTDLTVRKKMEDELHHRAQHDPLTDLPNRILLRSRLEEAARRCQTGVTRLAVMVLDLDGFKNVNDGLGHDAGDTLLLQVTQRWKALLREGDTLARVGGDEFAVILPTNAAVSLCTAVAERLVRAATRPFALGATTVQTGVSIGLVEEAQDILYQTDAIGRFTYVNPTGSA
jgi:diguanylate cyclase (GGDEF)-like protein